MRAEGEMVTSELLPSMLAIQRAAHGGFIVSDPYKITGFSSHQGGLRFAGTLDECLAHIREAFG